MVVTKVTVVKTLVANVNVTCTTKHTHQLTKTLLQMLDVCSRGSRIWISWAAAATITTTAITTDWKLLPGNDDGDGDDGNWATSSAATATTSRRHRQTMTTEMLQLAMCCSVAACYSQDHLVITECSAEVATAATPLIVLRDWLTEKKTVCCCNIRNTVKEAAAEIAVMVKITTNCSTGSIGHCKRQKMLCLRQRWNSDSSDLNFCTLIPKLVSKKETTFGELTWCPPLSAAAAPQQKQKQHRENW